MQKQNSAIPQLRQQKGWVWTNAEISKDNSMNTLLRHTFSHFTKPSFMTKTNNQPLKKSCAQLSKSRQKLDVILGNKVV